MAKKDRSRHILPSGDLFLRETLKTEPTSPLRTPQPTDWGRRTGRQPIKLIIEARCYILFVFCSKKFTGNFNVQDALKQSSSQWTSVL